MPTDKLIRLVSEEILTEDSENPINLLDTKTVTEYQDTQALEEQQALLAAVKKEFSSYLADHLGPVAVQWLQLYLQGRSQEAIARSLNLPVKEVYRLREKISYHAVRVFALKGQPELVGNWLEISLQEHSFGLTPQQWQQFCLKLTPRQSQLVELFKKGKTIGVVAQDLNLKTHQVLSEWSKLYLAAQALRSEA